MERSASALDDFASLDPATATSESVLAELTGTEKTIRGNAAELASLAAKTSNAAHSALITELSAQMVLVADSMGAMAAAITAGDDPALAAAGAEFEAAGAEMDVKTREYFQFLADHPFESGDKMWFVWTGLLALAVLMFLVAVILALVSGKRAREFPPLRQSRRNLLLSSLLFAVGAAIPAVQYWRIEPGEDYHIFYYPLACGLWFLFALPMHLAVSSHAKKAAKARRLHEVPYGLVGTGEPAADGPAVPGAAPPPLLTQALPRGTILPGAAGAAAAAEPGGQPAPGGQAPPPAPTQWHAPQQDPPSQYPPSQAPPGQYPPGQAPPGQAAPPAPTQW
ncbi:MAG: hypothetical protein LBD90_03610 [Bifidobacteriaceae bacterium]|nr:hypothetical protein [Bifidobacteriaceae bacterium]